MTYDDAIRYVEEKRAEKKKSTVEDFAKILPLPLYDHKIMYDTLEEVFFSIGYEYDKVKEILDTIIWNATPIVADLENCERFCEKYNLPKNVFKQKYLLKYRAEAKRYAKEQKKVVEAKETPRKWEKDSFLSEFEVTNVYKNVKYFQEYVQPFFYDKTLNFWFWNKDESKWVIVDETDILVKFDEKFELAGQTTTSTLKMKYLECFKRIGRQKTPMIAPPDWIQFKDKIVDIETGNEFKATPEHFFTNPIPWELGDSEETPMMDTIFNEWVGTEYSKTLFEILAFCLAPEYFLHRIFCLVGGGSNGKGKFMDLLRKFIGNDNVASTDLDLLLSSRFEKTKLYKKLAVVMGETNFNELKRTALLKQLSGGDLVGGEFKNKPPFDFVNNAKLIIATNGLPITTDKSRGFYRRWAIVPFINEFSEKNNVLDRIPEQEYNNLARKAIKILKGLKDKREFTNEGSIDERAKMYEDTSNPLKKFLEIHTESDPNGSIFKFELMERFVIWLKENGYREWSDKEVGSVMKDLYEEKRIDYGDETLNKRYRAWVGLKWLPRPSVHDVHDVQGVSITHIHNVASGNTVEIMDKVDATCSVLQKFLQTIQPVDEVFKMLRKVGMSDIEIEREISKEKEQGDIFEPRPGYLEALK